MMSFCESCGKPKKADEAVCSGCGASSVSEVLAPAGRDQPVPGSTASAAPRKVEPHVAGALSYAFGVISGIVFLLLEPYKRDRFVRFHAFQSIFFNTAVVIFWVVGGTGVLLFEAITGGFLMWLIIPVDVSLTLLVVGAWVRLMIKGYRGATWKLPVIGNFAVRQANK